MRRIKIGIVDYGVGNHASVWYSLQKLGYRCSVSEETEVLRNTDLLILPGVGAFPTAMTALHDRGLVDFLQQQAREEQPILGICLGMQLLVEASYENHLTAGIGLIPGKVVPLGLSQWHIGWNTLELIQKDPIMALSNGKSFYFNHSYVYQGPSEYQICIARQKKMIPAVIRMGKVLGMQFHPEKSQEAGRQLLKNVIEGLCHA